MVPKNSVHNNKQEAKHDFICTGNEKTLCTLF